MREIWYNSPNITLDLADERVHYTKKFERDALELTKHMAIKDVAHHLGVRWDTKKISKRNTAVFHGTLAPGIMTARNKNPKRQKARQKTIFLSNTLIGLRSLDMTVPKKIFQTILLLI